MQQEHSVTRIQNGVTMQLKVSSLQITDNNKCMELTIKNSKVYKIQHSGTSHIRI